MTNLNPIHECNARDIERMVGKAMCAWANWQNSMKHEELLTKNCGKAEARAEQAAHQSEYEATVRCIEMFVSDSIYAIQAYVVDRAEAEFGIK